MERLQMKTSNELYITIIVEEWICFINNDNHCHLIRIVVAAKIHWTPPHAD